MSSDVSPGHHLDSQRIVEDFFNYCLEYLQTKWTRKRVPKGFCKAWSDASATSQDNQLSTAQIFSTQGGFAAWLAFFLATRKVRDARGTRKQVMNAFEALPIEDRRYAAKRLAAASIDPSVQEAIDDLQQKVKRRRVEGANGDSQGEQPQSTSTALSPSPDDEVGGLNTGDSTLHVSTSMTARQHRFEHASAQATSNFFPPYMDSAIRRDTVNLGGVPTTTAAITMVFPPDPVQKKDCAMTLAIVNNKLERCARDLFGVNVETEGQFRYVVLQNGARILPTPELTLLDCQPEAIVPMFGPNAAWAIAKSEYHRQEEQLGRSHVTGCVSMIISSNANDGACITLNLGLAEASHTRKKLYV